MCSEVKLSYFMMPTYKLSSLIKRNYDNVTFLNLSILRKVIKLSVLKETKPPSVYSSVTYEQTIALEKSKRPAF